MTQNWGNGWYSVGLCFPPERSQQTREMSELELYKSSIKGVQNLEKSNPMHQWTANWLGSSFSDKDMGVLVDNNLNISQQCALESSNNILQCMRKSWQVKGGDPSLYTALLRPNLECWVQVWAQLYKREVE